MDICVTIEVVHVRLSHVNSIRQWRKREIFLGGGKVTFPNFLPAWSHFSQFFPGVIIAFSRWKCPFWSTPKNFHCFPKSEKQKKKFLIFINISHTLPSFPASFFPISRQKFPGGKSLSAPPLPFTPLVPGLLQEWILTWTFVFILFQSSIYTFWQLVISTGAIP